MTPEQFQEVALGWLGVISVVGAAVGTLVAKNWSKVANAIVAIAQLRARINAHDDIAGRDTSKLIPSAAAVAEVAKPAVVPPKQ